MRYKLTIEYDGGPFHGWQRLPDAPTVQGALEDAVEKLTGVRTDVIGAGRTDSGVHAYAQVAHVDIDKPLQAWQIVEALNAHIRIRSPCSMPRKRALTFTRALMQRLAPTLTNSSIAARRWRWNWAALGA